MLNATLILKRFMVVKGRLTPYRTPISLNWS